VEASQAFFLNIRETKGVEEGGTERLFKSRIFYEPILRMTIRTTGLVRKTVENSRDFFDLLWLNYKSSKSREDFRLSFTSITIF
jgi:hypothetical protein